jgi:hypothetical protein
MNWVLGSRIILVCPLPRAIAGLTIPFLPVILMSSRYCRENLSSGPARLSYDGRLAAPGDCLVAQTLLHECAHQLWAVWPEWRLWPRFFLLLPPAAAWRSFWEPRLRIYGADINAADAISEALCRDLCCSTRYPASRLAYRSPLARLHRFFRR